MIGGAGHTEIDGNEAKEVEGRSGNNGVRIVHGVDR